MHTGRSGADCHCSSRCSGAHKRAGATPHGTLQPGTDHVIFRRRSFRNKTPALFYCLKPDRRMNFRRNHPCPLEQCVCLDEHIVAGAIGLNEFVRDCFFPEAGAQLQARLERSFNGCSIREAENIRLGLPTFEDEKMQDEPEPEAAHEEQRSSSVYEQARRYHNAVFVPSPAIDRHAFASNMMRTTTAASGSRNASGIS